MQDEQSAEKIREILFESRFVYGLRLKLSKRRNKDGSYAYQAFLDKLTQWEQRQKESGNIIPSGRG